ncbi:hypothetical protein GVAV_002821 [Gurleya vavrai]
MNGRIERVIGTLRTTFLKTKGKHFESRFDAVVSSYNNTYHTSIKCTPKQALNSNCKNRILDFNLHGTRNYKKN